MLRSVFPEGKVGRSPQPKQREESNSNGRSSENSRSETFTQGYRAWHTRAAENVTVAPRRRKFATGRQEMEKGKNDAFCHKYDKKQVLRVKMFKPAHGYRAQESKPGPRCKRKTSSDSTISPTSSDDLSAIKIGAFSLALETPRQDDASLNQPTTSLDCSPPAQLDTARSERMNPTYRPNDSPRSRREMQDTRSEPPLTRPQDHKDAGASTRPLRDILTSRWSSRLSVNLVSYFFVLQEKDADIVHSLENQITYIKSLDLSSRMNSQISNLSTVVRDFMVQSHVKFYEVTGASCG
jgi:hypothetical protein